MDQIMIELHIPAAERSYDVLIPRHSNLFVITRLLSKAVHDLTQGKYLPQDDTILCDLEGKLLDNSKTADELGLRNGSKLMLI